MLRAELCQPAPQCPRCVPSACSLVEHIQARSAVESPWHGGVSASRPISHPFSAGREVTSQLLFSPIEQRGDVQAGRCAAAAWAGSSSQQ